MKIYIVIVEDKRVDTEVYPFDKLDKAIAFARKTAKENCRYEGDHEESDIEGWFFFATTSGEGNCVWGVEKELNESED